MKKIIMILLVFSPIFSAAEIKIESNATLSATSRAVTDGACKRLAAFYNWYMDYLAKNEAAPMQHPVYDQNITADMQSKILSKSSDKTDIFFAQKDIDLNADLLIKPIDVLSDRLFVLVTVTGKYNYSFKIEMKIRNETWCIHDVYRV